MVNLVNIYRKTRKSPFLAFFFKMSPTDLIPEKVAFSTKFHDILDIFGKSPWDWIGVWHPPNSGVLPVVSLVASGVKFVKNDEKPLGLDRGLVKIDEND